MSTEREDAAKEFAERMTAERQWPVAVPLKHPIDFGKERIEELEFRRGKLGDLDGVTLDGVPPIGQLLLIASRMCGKPVAALKLLQDEDGAEVLELALSFFARCLPGGKTP